jgi:hypothetical protein
VDLEAKLRNARAEEAQYLAILKRAAAVKDALEVSSKLAEVRGRIDESEADLRFLHHQVEMSLLTTNISAVAQAQVFGVHWQPLYEAKLSLRGALVGMADYADAMVALFLNLPVVVLGGFTILALLKVGGMVLRRVVLVFFPGLTTWLRRPVKSRKHSLQPEPAQLYKRRRQAKHLSWAGGQECGSLVRTAEPNHPRNPKVCQVCQFRSLQKS